MARRKPKNPKGGQCKPREIRALVLKIAKVSGFGYTRIIGELRKLGIKRISRQTVRNILKEEGIEPSPDRTSDKWENFLARHAETSWAADFFSVRTVTARGIRSSRDSLPPIRKLPEEVVSLKMEQIEVKSYVGGLIKSFERRAA